MFEKILDQFRTTMYVQIWENRIRVTDIATGKIYDEKPLVALKKIEKGASRIRAFGDRASLESGENVEIVNPFSHPRVLFADFAVGVKLLQHILKELRSKKIFMPSPQVVMHPMEKTEGGLTEIERRALIELALSAGAKDAIMYQGLQLATHNFDYHAIKSINEETVSSHYNPWYIWVLWAFIVLFCASEVFELFKSLNILVM